jgi:hypothetical protein
MVRLPPDRRVIGALLGDGTIQFRFRRLIGRDVHTHSIRLTPDALLAMMSIALAFGSVRNGSLPQVGSARNLLA